MMSPWVGSETLGIISTLPQCPAADVLSMPLKEMEDVVLKLRPRAVMANL